MLHEKVFRSMNTQIHILLEESGYTPEIDAYIETCFQETEQRFSRFRPASELSQLNQLAGERCLISLPMLQVLEQSRYYMEQTEGVFNIFMLDALQRAGYAESFEKIRGKAQTLPPRELPPCALRSKLDIDAAMRSVQLPSQHHMDLGGIVKSWAVEQLALSLQREWGQERGVISAGGDVKVWGGAGVNDPWIVAIDNPHAADADDLLLELSSGAVATSSTLRRSWQTSEGIMHHLMDPATMLPSQSSVVQCSVIGSDLTACEVWAKVLCILGLEAGITRLGQHAEGLEAVLFTADGGVHHVKPGFRYIQKQWIGLHADVQHLV
ncbi:FAD:protein FMN transferase [Paenibacillus aestuarii]|uniref:FAD:protein FMN transferase n=1 Tax=Paenibacillus aestuarii TaxID=516965 RepID=A0ABW0KEU7_9BACL|nr:FAD:protein FMN transferase [Paenibacillus aestuarii]